MIKRHGLKNIFFPNSYKYCLPRKIPADTKVLQGRRKHVVSLALKTS